MKLYEVMYVCFATDLQPLNDVSVVSGCRQAGVSSGSILCRESPAEDALLHNIIGLNKQIVHLTVQVHWDGNGSALSWLKVRMKNWQSISFIICHNAHSKYNYKVWRNVGPVSYPRLTIL